MLESLTHLAQQSGPFSLLLLLIGCSFGVPLAKSLIIVAGGVLAGSGNVHPAYWFLACALGLHLGDFFLYLIGRQWGEQVFEWRPVKKFAKPEHLEKAKSLVMRHGAASLLFARITPFVRSACYLMLGTLRMDLFKFNAINLSVSMVYSAVFFSLGFVFGNRPDTLKSWAGSWQVIIAVVILLTALYLLRFPIGHASRMSRNKAGVRNGGKT